MYLLLESEPHGVTCELHILVVDTEIRTVPDLFEKALHLARLSTVMNRQEKMVGQTMISDSPLGSAVVRASIHLALMPIDNQDPWHHRQELPWGRCGIFFKARVLQLGELDLIKGCYEIHSRGDRIHTTLATVATSFGSSMIIVPK
jgi:hypothetical protein